MTLAETLRPSVQAADAAIAECLRAGATVEDRERLLRDAWYAADAPVRQAMTFVLFSRVAEGGRS